MGHERHLNPLFFEKHTTSNLKCQSGVKVDKPDR